MTLELCTAEWVFATVKLQWAMHLYAPDQSKLPYTCMHLHMAVHTCMQALWYWHVVR